jgi:ABC-type transport system involved in multi-copper enzyme maturation permease subunit
LIPPIQGAAIAEDRERKILPILLASPLSSGSIVTGKLCSRLIQILEWAALPLPVLMFTSLLGGIDPFELLVIELGLVTTAFAVSGFAILVSALSELPRTAIFGSFLLLLTWLAGPWLLEAALGRFPAAQSQVLPLIEFGKAATPFRLLERASGEPISSTGDPWLEVMSRKMIGEILVGSALLLLTAVLLRRSASRSSESPRRLSRIRRARAFDERHPVLWKERRTRRIRGAFRVGILTLVFLGMGYLAQQFLALGLDVVDELLEASGDSARESLGMFIRLVTVGLGFCAQIIAAIAASTAFTTERENDTWLVLLSTPLEPEEIVGEKWLAAIDATRWLGIILAVVWVVGMLLLSIDPISFVLGAVVLAVQVAMAASIGIASSLRARTTAMAVARSLAVILALNLGVLFVCGISLLVIRGGLFAVCLSPIAALLAAVSLVMAWGHENGELILGVMIACFAHAGIAVLCLRATIDHFDRAADRPDSRAGIWFVSPEPIPVGAHSGSG